MTYDEIWWNMMKYDEIWWNMMKFLHMKPLNYYINQSQKTYFPSWWIPKNANDSNCNKLVISWSFSPKNAESYDSFDLFDVRFATHFWPGLGSSGIAGRNGGIGVCRVRRKTWRPWGQKGTGLEGPGHGKAIRTVKTMGYDIPIMNNDNHNHYNHYHEYIFLRISNE